MGAVINIPQDELYHLYIEEEKTDREIANIFNCCDATIREYRKNIIYHQGLIALGWLKEIKERRRNIMNIIF